MKLGNYETNNVYCGDSYKIIKELPDKCIDLIITDPPYEIKNTRAGGKSKLAKSIQGMNDELEENEITESIDPKIFDDFMRIMVVPNIYIWCNGSQIPMYLDYFVTKQNCKFDIIIWHKTNAMPLYKNKYCSDKEYCLYFRKNAYCNPQNYSDAQTVYEIPINVNDKKLFYHPTIKPRKITDTLIRNSSKVGDIIFDPFAGSGTHLVSGKSQNRNFLGFDNSQKWVNISKNRLNCENANGQQSWFLR
ncbi:MAG: site-specific DNA-methyltransferase [Spirochaetia bacterium]|nr:site-specific DNA-methyltransferase [Spirochaetia bacterium]